jgi:small redox-active disulfide protein 2
MKDIAILGTGCTKCHKLEQETRRAAAELSLDCEIRKVTAVADIVKYGVMTTPALVVDGRVVSVGKVPSVAEIKQLIDGEA